MLDIDRGDALFTDLYELTMMQAYLNEGMDEDAVFELFVRRLPPQRNFLVACGLEQVLGFLENLHFSPEAIEYLASLGLFTPQFLESLANFRFTGRVRAVPEGTIVFANEPIVEIEAPMPQAQVVETYVLNQVTFQTIIASKGARALHAARGRTLVDFGSRRAHGTDAAMKAARALYIAGFTSTSNVLAGKTYGIPVAGTMAHSYVQAHDTEEDAFRAFLHTFPTTVLLVDTYDTEAGVRRAARVAQEVDGSRVRAVRLDSGDLAALSKSARRILDEGGLPDVGIFASGGLDEYEIDRLLSAGAPIDAFGVGTSAVVSNDAPALDAAYKLVSYAGQPRIKLSPDKQTLPGRKQVFRRVQNETMVEDTLGLDGERVEGEPLLEEVMRDGERTAAGRRTLADARQRAREELARLPEALRALSPAAAAHGAYPVRLSEGLEQAFRAVRDRIAGGTIKHGRGS